MTIDEVRLPEFVGEEFKNEFRYEESHEQYHNDFTSISSSILKLFQISPRAVYSHYQNQAPEEEQEEGESDSPEPKHFQLGRALHAAALEPKRYRESVVQIPKFSGKGSQAAKKEWMLAQPKDAILLTPKMYEHVDGMIQSMLNCPDAVANLKNGIPELSGYYRDPVTGIKCRVRPDLWNEGAGVLIDVKSCRDSSARVFSNKILEYQYHVSMAMYADGIYQISGVKPSTYVLIAVESKYPYECAVYLCKDAMIQAGHEEYQYYMQKLKYCLETGIWPPRQAGMDYIDLPEWHYKKQKEVYEVV